MEYRNRALHRFWVGGAVALWALGAVVVTYAQDSGSVPVPPDAVGSVGAAAETAADFGFDVGIGVQSFPDRANPGQSTVWQNISLQPDLEFGPFGIGLDLDLNFRFNGGAAGDEFEIRAADWDPTAAGLSFLELYLQKIRYVSWGLKGDPLYVKLGSIEDGTLGNGFIMGNYSNAQFVPNQRLFGIAFDLDGALFEFPYVGLETFVSNAAAFEMVGGRLFTRPLIWSEIPLIKDLQIGGTVVTDTQPLYFLARDPASPYYPGSATTPDIAAADIGTVTVGGIDFRLPIVAVEAISLSVFGDVVWQNAANGGMLGVGGRMFGALTYGAQFRILGPGFLPTYFDATYDLFRLDKYRVYQNIGAVNSTETLLGWYASLGFVFLEDMLRFRAEVDSPFVANPTNPSSLANPNVRVTLILDEGPLPGFSFSASYEKRNITDIAQLVDPTNAVIGARINYAAGPAVLSLVYALRYDPFGVNAANEPQPWTVTSTLETGISLF